MKKLLAILLVTASIPLLWACDNESDKAEETTQQETTEITETAVTEKEEETIDDSSEREDFLITYEHTEKAYKLMLEIEMKNVQNELTQVRKLMAENSVAFLRVERELLPLIKKNGVYQVQLDNERRNYQAKQAEASAIEESLEQQLSILRKEHNNPNYETILQMIADDGDMSFAEAYRKYQKYMASEEE